MHPLLWVAAVLATGGAEGRGADADTGERAGVDGVVNERRELGGDTGKVCHFIHREREAPRKGSGGLLLVLPGGDGSEGFNRFLQSVVRWAVPDDFLVVQLVAPRWSESQRVVWPTAHDPVDGMRFTTGEFIREAVAEAGREFDFDAERVFTLSWSSGGPAAFAESLSEGTPVRGSFVAMSVFRPEWTPGLEGAEGQRYYLLQSPGDEVTPFPFAELAERELSRAGAEVRLVEYEGGHGWHGDVMAMIRAGLEWLAVDAGDAGDAGEARDD